MARTIHTRDERREQFIKAGLKIARKSGVKGVSGAAVARECSVTAPLIFHNFGSIKGFREAVAEAAKKQGVTLTEAATPVKRVRSKPEVVKAIVEKRKRSVAEVKAIKDKAAGKRTAAPKKPKVAKKVAAPKAVAAAKKPRTVTKTAKPAKAVVAAKKSRATRKPAAPRVSSAFSPMPAPAAPATTGDQQ